MKLFTKVLCVLLAFALMIPATIFAEEAGTWSSAFFTEIRAYLVQASTYTFEIWFDLTATGGMEELGVSEIKLERSSDNSNWMTIKTYEPDRYSQLMDANSAFHSGHVTYTGTTGFYFRARVLFYAKDETGAGTMTFYTQSLYMPAA